jgi:uncharacterized repeat protein (TIGR01451 family)
VAGANLTYSITVTNNGPSTALDVTMTDVLPPGTTLVDIGTPPAGWDCTAPPVGSGGTVVCETASMAPSTSAVLVIVVAVPADAGGTALCNNVAVDSATPDPVATNNTFELCRTATAVADLSVSKTASADPVVAGTNLTYTISGTNAGPSNAQNVTMGDVLPPGTTFVSLASPGGWSCTTPPMGGTGAATCTKATVIPGETATFVLVVRVAPTTPNGSQICNTATFTSSTADPDATNNASTACVGVIAVADLSVTKSDSPDPVPAGTSLTYTITVTNGGPSTATGVTVTDTLPPGVTVTSTTSTQGSCATSGGTVTCEVGTLQPAGTAVITIVVGVHCTTANRTLTNTVSVDADQPDPNPGNNTAMTTTTVLGASQCKVTGGGTVDVSGGFASFGLNASTDGTMKGNLNYLRHPDKLHINCKSVTSVAIFNDEAFIDYSQCTGTSNGSAHVRAKDGGEGKPPKGDEFEITYNGMTEGGPLRSGNIQIHN